MVDGGEQNIAIAIDGPAASGKSSVARSLARRMGYLYVNSGSLYRGVTWYLLEQGVHASEPDRVREVLLSMDVACGVSDGASSLMIGPFPGLSELPQSS